jgi:catechol 2,3-dioxygenase-like lactoylglutathione lyase family enzyme
MKIKVLSVFVDDQERALRFYTEVLGFQKKADFSNGPYRWLTVVSPEDADGPELQLATADPAAKAFQQARVAQSQPTLMLFTKDLDADVTASKIATVRDSCGNLVQITQLLHG